MSTYYMNEAAFDLPDLGFTDRTVTFLEARTPSGGEVALIVQRTPLEVGQSLREAVKGHVAQSTRKLRAWSVLSERDGEVSGAPAIEVSARFRLEDGAMMYARQAHLAAGTTWVVVSGNAPIADREVCDQVVDHVLSTLRIRD